MSGYPQTPTFPIDLRGGAGIKVRRTGPTANTIILDAILGNDALAPMPTGTLKANLLGSASIPQDVTLAALGAALGLRGLAYKDAAAISDVTGLQAALSGKQAALGFVPENVANKGQVNGYAPLGANGKVASIFLPPGNGGEITASLISDSSASGRAVLTGTPAQGRAALQIVDVSVPLTAYGADPTGATPSNGALQRAWAGIKATGGVIVIPPGDFVFTAREVVTLPDLRANETGRSITIRGAGMGATKLHWPNANGGLKIVSGHVMNSINVEDLTVSTGVPDGGEGIVFYGTDYYAGFRREPPMSTMRRVRACGLDTPATDAITPQINVNYWTRALGSRGVNGVTWFDCMVFGAAPNGEQALGTPQYVANSVRRGKGICVEGMDRTPGAIPDLEAADPNQRVLLGYGLIYNVYGGQINSCDIGFYYGDVVQGATLYGVNFGYCRAAVETAPDPLRGDLAQLYMTNCQSGAGTGNQVNIISQLFTLGMTNCTWFLYPGCTGLYMKHSVPFQVMGCNFQGGRSSSAPSIGIDIAGTDIPGGSIIGNTFRNSNVGIRLQAATSAIIVDGNQFASIEFEVSNSGDRNYIGIANIGEILTNPAVMFPPGPGNSKGSRGLSFRSVDAGAIKRDGTLVADPDGNMNLLMEAAKAFSVQGRLFTPTINVSGSATVGSLNVPGNVGVSGSQNVGGDLLVSGSQGVNGGFSVTGASRINGAVGFFGASPVGRVTISGPLLNNNEARIADILSALQNLGLITNSTTFS